MLRAMGPGGMMAQYEDMNKWFCAMEVNKAKTLCSASKAAYKGGPHPLFSKQHAQHDDWIAMAKGCARATAKLCHSSVVAFGTSLDARAHARRYCALEANTSKFVCKTMLKFALSAPTRTPTTTRMGALAKPTA